MLARIAVLQAIVLLCSCAGHTDNGLSVHDAWIREAPPGASAMAGYMIIENHGVTPRRLIGAESAAFKTIELHRSIVKKGTARMAPQTSISIPPSGGQVALEPNGRHLMMMGPARALRAGDRVVVALSFDRGESLKVMLPVKTDARQEQHAH
jgi:copper(I)-binding protein